MKQIIVQIVEQKWLSHREMKMRKTCRNCKSYHYDYDFDENGYEIDLSVCDKENYEYMESHDDINGYYGHPENCNFYECEEEE